MEIPVNQPVISKEAKKNVLTALKDGWLSSAGPFVEQFEKEFSARIGAKHGIAVSSGTAALHVTLLTLGIKPGDEIIVPAFTMGATWLAVMYTGAIPVFVDCDPETYNINPALIETKITPRTKAIMPVHIYGHAAPMDEINLIAKKHGILVIEDAAEAHGGTYKGKNCGALGDISCFSFYANKIVTTGEGGMILTDNDEWAKEARKFRDLYHSDKKRFIHEKIGYNYRITNLQAAVGCGELKNIDSYLAKKEKMAHRYNKGLKTISGISTPVTLLDIKNVYWVYSILVDQQKFGMSRDALKIALKENDIGTRDFFYAPSSQPVLREIIGAEKFPVTEDVASRGLYLPSGLAVTAAQIDYVVEIIRKLAK